MLSCEFGDILQNILFYRTLPGDYSLSLFY